MTPALNEFTLSPEQADAVASDDAAVIVVASAGSGKTEVVARRVERLLEREPDSLARVLAVTYTVKASSELRDRLRARLGSASQRVDTETVHGFAHSLLRQHGTNIGLPAEPELLVRDEDRAELLNRWLDDNGIEPPDDTMQTLRELDLARSTLTGCDFLDEWAQALENAGALDYSALLDAADSASRSEVGEEASHSALRAGDCGRGAEFDGSAVSTPVETGLRFER